MNSISTLEAFKIANSCLRMVLTCTETLHFETVTIVIRL